LTVACTRRLTVARQHGALGGGSPPPKASPRSQRPRRLAPCLTFHSAARSRLATSGTENSVSPNAPRLTVQAAAAGRLPVQRWLRLQPERPVVWVRTQVGITRRAGAPLLQPHRARVAQHRHRSRRPRRTRSDASESAQRSVFNGHAIAWPVETSSPPMILRHT
jgi:hypothetical protein